MNDFEQFFADHLGIGDPEVAEALAAAAELVPVKRGSFVMQIGEKSAALSLVVQGVFRGFVFDENGMEVTDCFAYEAGNALIGCNFFEEPSLVTFEALTDGVVLRIPLAVLMDMMRNNPEVLAIYNNGLMDALKRHWKIKRVLYRPAIERYQWFLKTYPELAGIVSHKHIASFLGMTPVTLSRLRAQLRQQPEENME